MLILVEGTTKRDTKSGQTLLQPMNEKVREVLLQQRELLLNSSAELQESSYVFPASDGGLRRLDSLKKRFSQLRDLAGIPKEFRPNYCPTGHDCFDDVVKWSNASRSSISIGACPRITDD